MDFLLNNIFVGLPKVMGQKHAKSPMDREWESGIFKELVNGPIWVGRTKLDGDGQADIKNHGGPEKAVFAYPKEYYPYWQQELDISDIKVGGMGENFSVANVTEQSISIGDTFEIGGAILQVSQPRQPCWKPARRYKIKNFALLIQDTGKTGWYFRVLQEGIVEAGQTFNLVDRPSPKWTIEQCNHVMHVDKNNLQSAAELAECEWLAVNWKARLQKRVEQVESTDITNRVYGPNEL
ncbi:MOSC domain-containing protein [Filibacter tadaridae]|uniref:6-N-hydroxylaminopurine resistance protein n=1 Tax=Filibacter tadaridae TaxID=2483811 RepID=A0A3P5X2T2_9BACL|nr:MOSC domain-containing protein [Filibacter tadaridae]VDC29470.1 6-N-hydroxylaminopurine resistance protein [Filibacter tadaridae]